MANNRDHFDAELEHERLESLINSMADGVIATDERCKVVQYNGAALNILDINEIKKGESINTTITLYDAEKQKLNTQNIVEAVTTQTVSRDYLIKYSDDSFANIYLSISPVHYGYGKKEDHGYVIIIRDITREKSLEEERDEFISVISHELRTPATTIEGSVGNALYITEKTNDIDKIKSALTTAHEQALYLQDMINDLSTLARAERGVLHESVGPVNPHKIAEYLLENYLKDAQDKGLDMRLDVDPSLELFNSVELYVKEILQNFVTNAIKYTESGSIVLSARTIPDGGGVEFAVTDTGIGISISDQSLVFEKFFRSEDYHTRKQNGTGLGLHVTKKLAEMTNAHIHVESKLGEGSTFTISFPNLD